MVLALILGAVGMCFMHIANSGYIKPSSSLDILSKLISMITGFAGIYVAFKFGGIKTLLLYFLATFIFSIIFRFIIPRNAVRQR